ncbi:hypothetical protein IA57_08225 [Mangrovimonas yunxiaonensis]|uniref:Lipoprotein n=1 Tax=Mangrovimonas yunxiaonensis TaxID=1197477 RepID=A0A084TIC2_9FLAO|nr:hypothetical protein [Mangrovimonas yunxiaonensis]KFB00458.1 hypothetical protein IA57_08225 [Mangrovimonas yunxiaonensis]GGH34633.1 hypothetical protein GCM10011364_00590 [Mangrovimonas yunxiaonensis]
MKNIHKLLLGLLFVSAFTACESDDEAEVIEGRDTAGAMVNVEVAAGSGLYGSPEAGVDLEDALVTISDASAVVNVTKASGSLGDIQKFELIKFFNGDDTSGAADTAVTVAESSTLPFTATLSSIDDFLAGLNMQSEDLRIGDSFIFKVKVYKNDGSQYYYANSRFALTLNCFYDLTGTYVMTNNVCASSEIVQISANSDGTWYATHADGGLLNFCSSNDITNPGSFAVLCGGVVDASNTNDGPDYCQGGGYGIGCIVGGSWDQDAGILVLENTNAFFSWAPAEYMSTYVRQ